MLNSRIPVGRLAWGLVFAGIGACQTGIPTGSTKSNVNFKMKANFTKDAASKGKADAAKSATCPTPAPTEDNPSLGAGLNCDGDGGVVRYNTPSRYKISVKRLSLLGSDGAKADIVADTGTLSAARVFDLTDVFTFDPSTIGEGSYPQYEAEIYYVEMAMPLYDAGLPRIIRVYLSDDDFASEGSKGHHQGDVAVIDDSGNELGLVGVGIQWVAGQLQAAATNAQRPGSTDGETGHQRGPFGDENLWNQKLFQQGADKDVFIWREPLGLTATTSSSAVTFSFNVKDCWFYEDFNNNQLFDPCAVNPGDACAPTAAWAPLIAKPEIVIE